VRERASQGQLLHIGVAWTGDAAGVERELHQSRTVDAEAGLPAPQVGRP
jgi:hypothetical protein